MGLADLQTAVQERIPVLVVVLNDRRYGMVELGNNAIYGRTPSYRADEIDVGELARGTGARALTIRHAGDILGAALMASLADGPLVLDVQIDPKERMPKNPRLDSLALGARRPRLVN